MRSPPRRRLTSFCALLLAALSPAAWAGQWVADGPTLYSGSKSLSTNGTTRSITWETVPGQPQFGGSPAWSVGTGPGGTASVSTSGTITVNLKWQPSDPNNPSADPPPSQVHVLEEASSYWYSEGYDNFGNTYTPPAGASSGIAGGDIDAPNVQEYTIAPDGFSGVYQAARIVEVDGSSGKITRSCQLNANATVSTPSSYPYTARVGVNATFAVVIHAHPYDFREGTQPGDVTTTDGWIRIIYRWKSTSGVLSAIPVGSLVYEHTGYNSPPGETRNSIIPGSNPPTIRPYYFAPDPPFPWQIPNPIDPYLYPNEVGGFQAAGSAGLRQDNHGPVTLFSGAPNFRKDSNGNYSSSSFTATQEYRFRCGDQRCPLYTQPQKVQGPDGGPHTITRKLDPLPNNPSHARWEITKGSHTAVLPDVE